MNSTSFPITATSVRSPPRKPASSWTRSFRCRSPAPTARIHHMTMMGGDPVIMLDAPLHATERALKNAGMSIADIDLFEVNEAFASVPTAWLKTSGADPARLNVNGGAIALGHPLGGSGTKLMTT